MHPLGAAGVLTNVAERVECAKNVDEDLVYHGEAESHAKSVATPEKVEQGGIVVPGCGEDDSKGDQLNENVTEEELEFAVQAPLEHDCGDPHLKDGMCDPEGVIENFNFLAHLSCSPLARRRGNLGGLVEQR